MEGEVKHIKAKQGIKKKYDSSNNKSSYSSKSLPYDKRNITHNTQNQVTSFRKSYKEVSADTQQLVDQIIDPEMQMSVVRVPTFGMSSTYTAHNIIQCSYDVNGRSCVAVNPNLQDAIFATAGNVYNGNLDPQASGNNPYTQQSIIVPVNGEYIPVYSPIYFPGGHVLLPFPQSTQPGRLLYAIGAAGGIGNSTAQLLLNFDNLNTSGLVSVTLIRYGSNFNILNSAVATNNGSGAVNITLFPTTATGYAYIAIEITADTNVPYSGQFNMLMFDNSGNLGYTLGNQAQHCLSYKITGADDISDSAQRFMVSSQSLKLTYQGSSQYNGGQLAIARMPARTVIGTKQGGSSNDNWYGYIANLSRNSYNGPVSQGGYCFYLGEDERSYFYRDMNEYQFTLPYMAAEWTSEFTPTQPVRIMVTTIVQFTTNSNIYDQKPSAYIGEDWCKLLHMLSCINASYDNPGHREKLRAALKKVGGKVIGLLKDPKTYATVGSIIAGLL